VTVLDFFLLNQSVSSIKTAFVIEQHDVISLFLYIIVPEEKVH